MSLGVGGSVPSSVPREPEVLKVPRVIAAANDFRDRVLERDQSTMVTLTKRWLDVEKALQEQIVRLAKEVEELGPGAPNRAYRLARYQDLLAQADQVLTQYVGAADSIITSHQTSSLHDGLEDAARLIQEAQHDAGILGGFQKLAPDAVNTMIGFASDGSPLRDLLQQIKPAAVQGLSQTMINGMALGKSPREMARDMRNGFGMGLDRALVIARDQSMRAYNYATDQQYLESKVVERKQRICAHNLRTCISCIVRDGEIMPLTQEMYDHVQGRCTTIPLLAHLAPPRIPETGREWFDRLDPFSQQQMMGITAWNHWKTGRIRWTDFAEERTHPTWGKSLRTPSVKDMLSRRVVALGPAMMPSGSTKVLYGPVMLPHETKDDFEKRRKSERVIERKLKAAGKPVEYATSAKIPATGAIKVPAKPAGVILPPTPVVVSPPPAVVIGTKDKLPFETDEEYKKRRKRERALERKTRGVDSGPLPSDVVKPVPLVPPKTTIIPDLRGIHAELKELLVEDRYKEIPSPFKRIAELPYSEPRDFDDPRYTPFLSAKEVELSSLISARERNRVSTLVSMIDPETGGFADRPAAPGGVPAITVVKFDGVTYIHKGGAYLAVMESAGVTHATVTYLDLDALNKERLEAAKREAEAARKAEERRLAEERKILAEQRKHLETVEKGGGLYLATGQASQLKFTAKAANRLNTEEQGTNSVNDAARWQFRTRQPGKTAKEEAVEQLKHFTEEWPIRIRRGIRGATSILTEGRFKTQFETQTSGGLKDNDYRAQAELKGLGVPRDVDPKDRPIYGYLWGADELVGAKSVSPKDGADSYGHIEFELRDELKARSTFTVADSLGNLSQGNVVGCPFTKPTLESTDGNGSFLLAHTDEERAGIYIGYMEVQVQGGIELKDVRRVVFHPGAYEGGRAGSAYYSTEEALASTKKLIDLAKAQGLEVLELKTRKQEEEWIKTRQKARAEAAAVTRAGGPVATDVKIRTPEEVIRESKEKLAKLLTEVDPKTLIRGEREAYTAERERLTIAAFGEHKTFFSLSGAIRTMEEEYTESMDRWLKKPEYYRSSLEGMEERDRFHKLYVEQKDYYSRTMREIPRGTKGAELRRDLEKLSYSKRGTPEMVARSRWLAEADWIEHILPTYGVAALKEKITGPGIDSPELEAVRERFIRSIDRSLLPAETTRVRIEKDEYVTRGFTAKSWGAEHTIVSLPVSGGPSLLAHELGHVVEFSVPGAYERAKLFLEERIMDSPPGSDTPVPITKLTKVIGASGFDPSEMVVPDRFHDPYCGKIADDHTEIISMGMQYLLTDPVAFAREQPHYFDFMIEILQNPEPLS